LYLASITTALFFWFKLTGSLPEVYLIVLHFPYFFLRWAWRAVDNLVRFLISYLDLSFLPLATGTVFSGLMSAGMGCSPAGQDLL
jgi:hypothetical protein